jgi:hypothetical protein
VYTHVQLVGQEERRKRKREIRRTVRRERRGRIRRVKRGEGGKKEGKKDIVLSRRKRSLTRFE